MTTTMADIAKHAEVSKSTVSLVLNEKPGVSAELKDVVLRAATELGYQLPKSAFCAVYPRNHPLRSFKRNPAAPASG
jgi:LacI family transcriptional regulator